MTSPLAGQTPKHRRRALATLPILAFALAAAAPAAGAAVVETLPRVQYAAGERSMPIVGTGFSPNGLVTLRTTTPSTPIRPLSPHRRWTPAERSLGQRCRRSLRARRSTCSPSTSSRRTRRTRLRRFRRRRSPSRSCASG